MIIGRSGRATVAKSVTNISVKRTLIGPQNHQLKLYRQEQIPEEKAIEIKFMEGHSVEFKIVNPVQMKHLLNNA